jgi:hypothetical protein
MSNVNELVDKIGLEDFGFYNLSEASKIHMLLSIISDNNIATCECCGNIRYLITHHWYKSMSFPLKEYTKRICSSCNGILTRKNMEIENFKELPHISKYDREKHFYVTSHILPEWELQLKFYKLFIKYNKH